MNADDAGASDPIAVAVPVRNEVEHLPRLLAALATQRDAAPFTLCLFFDSCTDGSRELVAGMAPRLPFAIVTDCSEGDGAPNAGLARGRAMALGTAVAPGGVLLTTDADSAPAPDWIAANLDGLAQADIVAGRIVPDAGPPSAAQERTARYYDGLHAARRRIDPVAWDGVETHHWCSAASLAMRTSTYLALGGFRPVPSGEDAALCDAAARAGYRLRRDARVVVRTSSRRVGRAERGFAAALAALDGSAPLPQTAHPEDEAWRFRMQADARRAHGGDDYRLLADRLGLSEDELRQVAAECRNGEAFAARIVGAPPGGMRAVSFDHAELLLAALADARLAGAA